MDDQTPPPGEVTPETTYSANGDATPQSPQDSQEPRDTRPAATPDMEADDPASGAVPPGYDWPTHGGYLGCLVGLMPGCLVAAFLDSTFIAWLNKAGVVPPVAAGVLVVTLFVVFMIGFGRLGWVLGRRFYRKYPQSEGSWGEDDAAPAVSMATPQRDELSEQPS